MANVPTQVSEIAFLNQARIDYPEANLSVLTDESRQIARSVLSQSFGLDPDNVHRHLQRFGFTS